MDTREQIKERLGIVKYGKALRQQAWFMTFRVDKPSRVLSQNNCIELFRINPEALNLYHALARENTA